MNKQSHLMMWDQQRMRHGITLRVLDQLPADKVTAHPIPGMRSPIELVVHMYLALEFFPKSVLDGSLGGYDEKPILAGITTKDQLIAFVKQQWAKGDAHAQAVTDAQLGSIVKTPWGDFPGMAMFGILYDEYLHHRGQLYAFVRAFGLEPVMVWDFDHNAAEYQPKQHA